MVAYYTKKGSQTCYILLLGEGERIAKGATSGEGEFDGIDWMRYAGRLLEPYNALTGAGNWIFHPGLETNVDLQFADPVQGRPTFFPELDSTFSGIPYIEVKLPTELSEGTGEPSESQVRVRTSKIQDYDNAGNPLGKSLSANNARIVAFMAKYYGRMDIANLIHWPSWKTEFRDRCDFGLGWSAGGGDGLTGQYYNGNNFNSLVTTRVDERIEFNFGNAPAVSGQTPGQPFTIRWTGKFEATTTETHTFHTFSKDGCRLIVNGSTIINNWGTVLYGAIEASGVIALTAGQKYDITLEYMQNTPTQTGQVELWYSTPTISKQLVSKDRLYSTAAIATNGRTIQRFRADVVFPGVPWPRALQEVMNRSGGVKWRWENGKMRFLWGPGRTVVKRFTYDPQQTVVRSNIVQRSVLAKKIDPSKKPNFFTIGYRNLDADLLDQQYYQVKRPELRNQANGKLNDLGIYQIGVARQSEAERFGETQMRRLSDRDTEVQLKGQQDSTGVAKCDLVELSHPLGDWRETPLAGQNPVVTMEVVTEVFESTIETANEKGFIFRIWNDGDYDDTLHGPINRRGRSGDIVSRFSAPPPVESVTLTEGLVTAQDGTVQASLNGVVQFARTAEGKPATNYPYYARVYLYTPDDGAGVYNLTHHVLTPTQDTAQASFSIPGIKAGTYSIKVVTYTLAGSVPQAGGVERATAYDKATTGKLAAPAMPTGLTVISGTGKLVEIRWTKNAESDVSEYGIWRNTTNNAGTAVKIAEADTNKFLDADVTIGQQYFYWITAINRSERESVKSGVVSVTPSPVGSGAVDSTPPNAPGAATLGSSGTYLSHDGTVLAFLRMTVQAKPTGSAWQNLLYKRVGGTQWLIAGQHSNSSQITDTPIDDLVPGQAYDVGVQAFSTFGIPSSITLATGSPFTAPVHTTAAAVPTGLAVISGTGRLVELSWTANSESFFAEYAIYRNTVNNAGTATKIAEARTNKFQDANVTLGQQYFYWVTSITTSEVESAKSGAVSVTPQPVASGSVDATAPNAPGAPTKTSEGTYLSGDGSVFSFLKFTVQAKPGGSAWQNLLYKRNTDTQWQIGGQFTNAALIIDVPLDDLTPGVSYDVAVQAFSTFGIPSSITNATGSPFVAPNKTTGPGAGVASATFDGQQIVWSIALPADTDLKRIKTSLSTAGTNPNYFDGTIFKEYPSGSSVTRYFWIENHSGVLSARIDGSFTMPTPLLPSGISVSFDGIRWNVSWLQVLGVTYELAKDQTGSAGALIWAGDTGNVLIADPGQTTVYLRAKWYSSASAYVAINLAQYLRLRGRDTSTVNLAAATDYGWTQEATERDADMIAFKVFCDFAAALSQTDPAANLDSVAWARVQCKDKFGNIVAQIDSPYNGRGIVGDFYFSRKYTDFDSELIVGITFFNAFGWTPDSLWIAPGNIENGTTQPTLKTPANCPQNLTALADNSNNILLNFSWTGTARSVWMRAISGTGQGSAGTWTDITASVTGDRITTATVPASLITPAGRYEFRVNDGTANAAGNSSNIAWVKAKDAPAATPERSAPSGLTLTGLSTTSFRATWIRNATDNTDVQYSLNSGAWTSFGSASIITFDFTGRPAGSVNTLAVRNAWSSGTPTSGPSTTETIDLEDEGGGGSPNDPTNLAIITNSRVNVPEEGWQTRVRFTWLVNSGNPPTLHIYQGASLVDSFAYSSGTQDSGEIVGLLNFSTEYRAYVTNGNGVNPSNEVVFTTIGLP